MLQEYGSKKLSELQSPANAAVAKQVTAWHEAYAEFRGVALAMANALELYHEAKFSEALPYFIHAYRRNNKLLLSTLSGSCKSLPSDLLRSFRKKCLLVSTKNPNFLSTKRNS